ARRCNGDDRAGARFLRDSRPRRGSGPHRLRPEGSGSARLGGNPPLRPRDVRPQTRGRPCPPHGPGRTGPLPSPGLVAANRTRLHRNPSSIANGGIFVKTSRGFCAITATLVLSAVVLAAEKKHDDKPREGTVAKLYEGLEFRNIGPHRGGRVDAVAGVRGQPLVFYFGGTGGGVWKTVDGGSNWQPMSDKDFKTGSVGAIGIAESDPNVIYAGMGEAAIRGNVSHGDGVYKSTDAGKTWKNVGGLDKTYQISRVRVHPKNPDLVYVAAQGHVWGSNPERGIYRSKDGGKSWEKVLSVSEKTGACDLAM